MQLLVAQQKVSEADELARDLRGIGHDVLTSVDGREVMQILSAQRIDALVLDTVLATISGLDVAVRLRQQDVAVPILFVSSDNAPADRVVALDAGGDGFLARPVTAAEIDAYLRAVLRRISTPAEAGIIRVGDIELNEIRHRVVRAGRGIALQNLEYRLLRELMRNANSAVGREALYRDVWGYEAPPQTNVVEAYVRRLRRQLNRSGETDPIVTIRGIGYMLTDRH